MWSRRCTPDTSHAAAFWTDGTATSVSDHGPIYANCIWGIYLILCCKFYRKITVSHSSCAENTVPYLYRFQQRIRYRTRRHFVLSKPGVKCGLRTLPKPARRGKMRTGSANLVRILPPSAERNVADQRTRKYLDYLPENITRSDLRHPLDNHWHKVTLRRYINSMNLLSNSVLIQNFFYTTFTDWHGQTVFNILCPVLPLWFSGIPMIVLHKFPSWR